MSAIIQPMKRVAVPLTYLGRSYVNCVNYKILNRSFFLKNPLLSTWCISSARIHNSPLFCQQSAIVEVADEVEEPDKLYKLIEVELRGNDKAVMKSYSQFSKTAAEHLGVEIGKCWTPTKAHHERFTVLKAIHVCKKNLVQYEFRTYFRFMQFLRLTGSTADTFLEYLQRNLPEGVAMKVTKIELQKIPSHIKPMNLLKENSENKDQLSLQ